MVLSHHTRIGSFGRLLLFLSGTQFAVSSFAQDATGGATDRPGTNRLVLPKFVDQTGRVTSEGTRFTTKAYEREALRLVIEEANRAASDLRLPEALPITE